MNIRLATRDDSLSLLSIYAQYIDTPTTFEITLPTEEEFKSRIEEIIREYPYIICEDESKIVGYAYAHRYKSREAYQWDAELSIYLDKNYTSKGIGKKLYNILFEILKLQNIKIVYGCVTYPNERSENLHKYLGFEKVGVYHKTGYKCGEYHDVIWYEKEIGLYNSQPLPFISIDKIPERKINNLLF